MGRCLVKVGSSLLLGSILTLAACVHHPRRAELRTYSRKEALDLTCQAIRLRYDGVRMNEAHLGRVQSSDRYESDDPPIRTRAYLGLTPGEFGWAVEITVVREELTGGQFRLDGIPAGWAYDGRDYEMERVLAEALTDWLRHPSPVFVESAPTRPSETPPP